MKLVRLFICVFCILFSLTCLGGTREVVSLSGDGWKLWRDAQVKWQKEKLCFTYDEALCLPIACPTKGWSILTSSEAMNVNVPGTAEEYLQKVSGPEGDIVGVTWWSRFMHIPYFSKGEKVFLCFSSIRSRAEIFINQELVGYQIVENTPFKVDITPFVKGGETAQLSVRITDAGGNHDWRDYKAIPWGDELLPPGHGFGGITGDVSLEICSNVYIADIYMQNTPQITKVNAILTINNTRKKAFKGCLRLSISEWGDPKKVAYILNGNESVFHPGENILTIPISVPDVKLWNIDAPNLYICSVELLSKEEVIDRNSKRFGFRWFDVSGIGKDAMLRLNGKRIMLRSAISWSYWPVNGIFPTDELAKRQVIVAKSLGLNMLNFHRFVGHPKVLDYADELGLLLFEEPGGFRLDVGKPLLNRILNEKVMRMVYRDRSHPSLVIYNMMNEGGEADSVKLAMEIQTIKKVHELDPSRFVLRISGWAKDYVRDMSKIHMRPYQDSVYWSGWCDYHRAGGPAVWNEDLYKNPDNYYNNTKNKQEIVFFGEEGALSAPPRLEKDKEDLVDYKYLGWDASEYLNWYDSFNKFLDVKNLRNVFPTVDSFTLALGKVSYEHQGRKIESARMNNWTDAYVINGWESELIENYSGIVDCFRYPKSDVSIIARRNAPVYIAVKVRKQITQIGDSIIADFYLINEENLNGMYRLNVTLNSSSGTLLSEQYFDVNVAGRDTYGQLLVRNVKFKMPEVGGMYNICAKLYKENEEITSGFDKILAVDLTSNKLKGIGAVWEDGTSLQSFLKGKPQEPVRSYADNLNRLDWVIVARPPQKEQLSMVPLEALCTSDGQMGLEAFYYEDMEFQKEVYRTRSKVINISVLEGATPDPHVHMLNGYGIIWKGKILPPVSGYYTFGIQSNDRSIIEVWINEKKIYEITNKKEHIDYGKIYLEKGEPANLEVKFKHPWSNARCRLDWAVPNEIFPDADKLLERAEKDGTKIFILQDVDKWAEVIERHSRAKFKERFLVGTNWLGGVMFNKPHPVFKELPAGDALNWPYQALIHTGAERMGFVMEGEELLVGAYHTYPMELGTTMGIIPIGKGFVLFSTLDIYGNLLNDVSAGIVAKKMILNMIDLN